MTTLVDAAVKVRRRPRTWPGCGRELDAFTRPAPCPFYVMKSNGGVLSADEVVHQPITTVLSGPGRRRARRRAGRPGRPATTGCSPWTAAAPRPTSAVVLDGEPTLTTEGTVGAYPCKIPMIDIVTVGAGGGSVAWLSPEGTLKVGPRSAGADPGPLCYGRGGVEPTVTDAHLVLGRIPPHLLGGEVPLDHVGRPRRACPALGAQAGPRPDGDRRRHPGDLRLEPGQRAAPDHRQAWPRRARLRARHVRRLRLAAAVPADRHPRRAASGLVPRDPGNLSAFGLLTVDVKATTCRRTWPGTRGSIWPPSRGHLAALGAGRRRRWPARASPPAEQRFRRTADLRYFGQAFEVRVPLADGVVDQRLADAAVGRVPRRARGALRLLLPGQAGAAGRVGQPARHRHRPDHPSRRCGPARP